MMRQKMRGTRTLRIHFGLKNSAATFRDVSTKYSDFYRMTFINTRTQRHYFRFENFNIIFVNKRFIVSRFRHNVPNNSLPVFA